MSNIPNLGKSLMLDFILPSIDSNYLDSIDKDILSILKHKNCEVISKNNHSIQNNYFSKIYYLDRGILTITSYLKEKALTVEAKFLNIDNLHSENLILSIKEFEVAFCDYFGWNNCSGNVSLNRGDTDYHFLNFDKEYDTVYKDFKLINREQTNYQDLRVFESKTMGKVLCLDYMIQNYENIRLDNYTTDLCSLVLDKNKKHEEVLVIGGGDLIFPKHILKEYKVTKLILVEIDERVIENTKKYFKFYEKINEYISQGCLDIVIEDGAKYLKDCILKERKFDGIIIDNSDVDIFEGPAANLFTKEFYSNIKNCLKKECAFSQQVTNNSIKEKWEKIVKSAGFTNLKFINSHTPEYAIDLPLGSGNNI